MTLHTAPTTTTGPAESSRPVGTYRPVVGDGSSATTRAAGRWRRWRGPLLIAAVVILVAVIAALSRPPVSRTFLAPDNPAATGAQAVSRVLAAQGVTTTYVQHTADAVNAATKNSTLLVVDNDWLNDEQIDALRDTPADIVLVEPGYDVLDAFTNGGLAYDSGWSPSTARSPNCDDPDALAAGTITTPGSGMEALSDDFATCFATEGETSGVYGVGENDGRTLRVFSDAAPLLNESITKSGNAALALRSLGQHPQLIWYIPDADEYWADDDDISDGSVLPPWADVVLLQIGVVAIVALLWRARRLGPLVTEDLPVIVRAAETTRGRGRLYRRSKSRGHAAAGLRAATADRLATALGLARSTSAEALIEAVSRATGRPGSDIAAVLYGPPPTDDAALLALARYLDHIESEVHQP